MAAASPALLARGCVNIVSLEGIRTQAADRWPRIRDGVYARMEALLRQKLGPTDFFVRIDDDSYMVTMPSAEPEDVNVVCLRVAYDLYSSFIGRCDAGNVYVSTATGANDQGLILSKLPAERIQALAEKAGINDLVPPPSTGAAPLLSVLAEKAAHSRTPQRQTGTVTTLAVSHQFLPLWTAPANAITTYICEPKAITVIETNAVLPAGQLSPKERVQVELSCLHAGIAQLARSNQKGSRFLLGVTIPFDVLGAPNGRMEFLSACHNLSSEYRQYLDVTLIEVPPGVAQTRLNNMVNMLRPFARSVSATVAPACRIYGAYQGIGLRSIGLDLREYAGMFQTYEDDLRQLVHMAKAMKLSTFLFNLKRPEMLKSAAASSVQLLGGPLIGSACTEPPGMSRLTWNDITGGNLVAL
jgi:hypothetical protein